MTTRPHLPMLILASTLCAAVLLHTSAAWACSLVPGWKEFQLEPDAPAEPTPGPVALRLETLSFSPPTVGSFGSYEDSCSSSTASSYLTLTLEPYQEGMGYILEVVDGQPPASSSLVLGEAIAPWDYTDGFAFRWSEGEAEEPMEVDFSLVVTPINAAGVRGPTSEPLRIYRAGRPEGASCGQAAAPHTTTPQWPLLLLLGLAGLARRRR